MAKVRIYDVRDEERYELIGNFLESVISLKDRQDVIDFFVGLLTPSELLMISRRIKIAQEILEGSSYFDIQEKLGVGSLTVAKTEKWLRKGDKKRQKRIVKALQSARAISNKKNREKEKVTSHDPLDKYAYHRFTKELLNIFLSKE
jgi:uncharacterized protein YerC